MQTAKVFTNGRSQAIRLPKEYRFRGKEVYIRKYEGILILYPKTAPWAPLLNSVGKFTDDFMQDRNQPSDQQTRGPL